MKRERVLICGDRNWGKQPGDASTLRRFIAKLPDGAVVIAGAAKGADAMAAELARDRGLRVIEFPADWAAYGRAAGPIRNRQMLDEGRPTRVVAFHRSFSTSRGTANMVQQAAKRGVPHEVRPRRR